MAKFLSKPSPLGEGGFAKGKDGRRDNVLWKIILSLLQSAVLTAPSSDGAWKSSF